MFKEFLRLKILAKISFVISSLSSAQVPATLDSLVYDKPYDLTIPTPDGSGQGVHPDIIRTGEAEVPYILAFTPYPFTMDKFENPSILVSDDGLRFHEERKGINPLVPAPAKDHNDDPDVFYRDGIWNLLYLETLRPDTQNLVLLESTDRLEWKSRIVYSANLQNKDSLFMLSPSYASSTEGNFLFYVSKLPVKNTIEFVRETSDLNFDFNDRKPVAIDLNGLTPWHVDIIRDTNFYYMLICTVTTMKNSDKQYSLHVARSPDLHSWEFSAKCILDRAYRSSGFVNGDDLFVYYSRQKGFLSPWHIGVYRTRLSEYFGETR